MNKKGVGIIGSIFFVILFIIMWFIWLAPWITTVGENAIQTNSLQGFEAFLYMNLNLIILVCLFLFLIGFAYFGSEA